MPLSEVEVEDEDWITELRRYNYSEVDHIEFISDLLTRYKCDRPFVLHSEYLEDLHSFRRKHIVDGGQGPFSVSFHRGNCGHQGLDSLPFNDGSPKSRSPGNLWFCDPEFEALRRDLDVFIGLGD